MAELLLVIRRIVELVAKNASVQEANLINGREEITAVANGVTTEA